MTFEEFQSTRRSFTNLGKDLDNDDEYMAGQRGYIYNDSFYIMGGDDDEEFSLPGRGEYKYCLILGNSESYEDNLQPLEKLLWDEFANDEINSYS